MELHKIFDLCADIIFREITLNSVPPINAVTLFADTMIDKKIGSETILKAILQEISYLPSNVQITKSNVVQILSDRLLTVMSLKNTSDFLELVDLVLKGGVAMVIDGSDKVLVCFVGSPEGRAIEEPITEPVVRGPRDGFVEDYHTNLFLIRRRIKSSRLKVELLEVGIISKTTVALCYLKGIAQESLIEEVKKRINRIKIDVVHGSGTIEEMIADQPFSLFPLLYVILLFDQI